MRRREDEDDEFDSDYCPNYKSGRCVPRTSVSQLTSAYVLGCLLGVTLMCVLVGILVRVAPYGGKPDSDRERVAALRTEAESLVRLNAEIDEKDPANAAILEKNRLRALEMEREWKALFLRHPEWKYYNLFLFD